MFLQVNDGALAIDDSIDRCFYFDGADIVN